MKLVISNTNDPHANLAMEEKILTERSGTDVLFLYINEPSVILGRNQTIEAEVDVSFCERNHIIIKKRMSGGGAVYHDLGNINFSFIRDKTEESVLDKSPLHIIIDVLRTMGIDAIEGRRKDIWVDGKKISGTAAHVTRTRELFHGTLLFSTDLNILHKALNGNAKARGKGVASVQSPVVNISEFLEEKISASDFLAWFVEMLKQHSSFQ